MMLSSATWHYMVYYLYEMVEAHLLWNKDKVCDLLYMSLQLAYSRKLIVHVADSTQQAFVTAEGQGEEPQLEFCPSVLQLGPCLPANTEVEAEIIIQNPCTYPIELYSLELDTQYREEEKVSPL